MSGPRTPPHLAVATTRRPWSAEEKRAILAEAGEAKTSISDVARRHGIHASLLFRWRRNTRDSRQSVEARPPATFVPLALPAPATSSPLVEGNAGRIEVELAGGHRVRAEAGADPAVLRSVIEALVGR